MLSAGEAPPRCSSAGGDWKRISSAACCCWNCAAAAAAACSFTREYDRWRCCCAAASGSLSLLAPCAAVQLLSSPSKVPPWCGAPAAADASGTDAPLSGVPVSSPRGDSRAGLFGDAEALLEWYWPSGKGAAAVGDGDLHPPPSGEETGGIAAAAELGLSDAAADVGRAALPGLALPGLEMPRAGTPAEEKTSGVVNVPGPGPKALLRRRRGRSVEKLNGEMG